MVNDINGQILREFETGLYDSSGAELTQVPVFQQLTNNIQAENFVGLKPFVSANGFHFSYDSCLSWLNPNA